MSIASWLCNGLYKAWSSSWQLERESTRMRWVRDWRFDLQKIDLQKNMSYTAAEIQCPAGTIYKECANACGSSCGALQSSHVCSEQCVPGCTCLSGQVSILKFTIQFIFIKQMLGLFYYK